MKFFGIMVINALPLYTHTYTGTYLLNSVTLKNRKEKDQFFLDLPSQLHSLPQAVVVDNYGTPTINITILVFYCHIACTHVILQ